MRILQLAPVWESVPPPGYGGTETVVDVLTEELVARGHDVLLCASGDSVSSADLFSVVPQSLRRANLTQSAVQFAIVHTARALENARDFDIIHNHNGPPNDFAMAMSGLIDVPMLTTLHNLPTEDSTFIWDSYGGWYNCISHRQLDTLPPLPAAHCAGVVYNAIDVATFPYQRHKSDYLLFIGRLSPDKAPHLAIQAARRAGRRLLLAGKVSTEEEKQYFETCLRPEIDGIHVEYLGEADARLKRELYAQATGLLVPLAWDEPFGLVIIEAMACGTPVIAFRRGAAPELIHDGETGYLVEDLEGMVEAIYKLDAIDPACCRTHIENNFSPAALADSYLSVYERILQTRESRLDRVAV
jgi:glycosyltransferase involved in cell wall biosynthesis